MADEPGSLSKEFPLAQLERSLEVAAGNMPYKRYLERVGLTTNRELAAITWKRFLLVRDNVIIRDKLLSLIETEGVGSPRMRKILFGVWTLRDPRLKKFILQIVADNSGHWRVAELFNKQNARFFEEWFNPQTSKKVRSNVERFLVETGIVTVPDGPANLTLADNWFADVIAILAEHENNVVTRREMLLNPAEFSIRQGINGVANATADEVRGITSVESTDDEVELIEDAAPSSDIITQDDLPWARAQPQYTDARNTPSPRDPVAHERAGLAHHGIEKLLVERVCAAGLIAQTNPTIDLHFESQGKWVIAEIKSCHDLNYHTQVRRGVSQLFEYEYRSRRTVGTAVRLLVMESAPPPGRAWLLDYLREISILVVWRAASGDRIVTTLAVPPCLESIVDRV